ncbi:MAG TPA: MFS transporter, partial [Thermodesulfobacteriota bacterium]|nr:MFS transporter [Thermodesulfobacteriota bacterium]
AAAGTPSPWRVLRSRDVWLVSIATILFAGLQASLLGYLVLFLQERQGLSVVAAGRVLAGAQMAGLAGRIVFGVLSDRLFGGRRRVVLFLAGATSACLAAAMARVGPGTPLWVVAPLSLLFGFVGIGWNGVQLTLLAELAGKALAGTAVGLGLAVSAVGVIAVPPAFGRLVEATGDYRWAWLSLTGIMLAALLLLVPVREPARRR